MARLKTEYKESLLPKLKEELGVSNPMAIPRLQKITINMGLGEATSDKKVVENAVNELSMITGQKAVVTMSKKSVAGFKIRDGWPIGAKVTLRGEHMYEFLDRLINVAIPRIRDFRGLSPKSFDGRGNYNMGVKEQIIFPEIDFEKIDAVRGMDIAFTISGGSDEQSRELLKAFGFPFKEK